ncbi:MAG: NADH-quinone oxidoreductase subunit NuoF [SAR202 cluster bacterium]|nr:NADH-quinone oxidoreductase subunit NuoF [SAR202 cluster bacterium]MDP6799457.1 NADH-quinone oxidoreductase subunit NuoF [SAR202 cluster bacterium]
MEKMKSAKELRSLSARLADEIDGAASRVRICMTGCRAQGADEIRDALAAAIADEGLEDQVEIRETGCQGFCARAPVLAIEPQGVFYQELTPRHVSDIVTKTLRDGETIGRLLYRDPESRQRIAEPDEVPFFKGQTKRVLRNCGVIDPTKISHYIARDGYAALARALFDLSPEEVIKEITDSGLRGRGGAGFSTGVKWGFVRSAPGATKYVICNGNEGDPGAFMDLAMLEGDPHAVLEGMIIAAYAVDAAKGYVYVRGEYPIAVEHLRTAISQASELGLVGRNILGSGFDFEIDVIEGQGAFVCGEETALIASIEGQRGVPRPRPLYPSYSGLWGRPTNVNNTETFANVSSIILRGAGRYAEIGNERGKGTKIFALGGKIENTGLVEAQIGISLREVIYEIGGGIPRGRAFKAAQLGGPSGGCVPEQHLDLPLDYDSLESIGAVMGSGSIVVMDDDTCMVDTARFFLSFTQVESCGKCVPCRVGTKRMLEILTRITEGNGREGDIDLLVELAQGTKDGSLCGLGQMAPNPVLTTLAFFRDEYQEHIVNRRCPGGVCEALIQLYIDPENCKACMICLRQCPVDAIEGGKDLIHVIDQDLCSKCGVCALVCPPRFDAVKAISGGPTPARLPEEDRAIVRTGRKSG